MNITSSIAHTREKGNQCKPGKTTKAGQTKKGSTFGKDRGLMKRDTRGVWVTWAPGKVGGKKGDKKILHFRSWFTEGLGKGKLTKKVAALPQGDKGGHRGGGPLAPRTKGGPGGGEKRLREKNKKKKNGALGKKGHSKHPRQNGGCSTPGKETSKKTSRKTRENCFQGVPNETGKPPRRTRRTRKKVLRPKRQKQVIVPLTREKRKPYINGPQEEINSLSVSISQNGRELGEGHNHSWEFKQGVPKNHLKEKRRRWVAHERGGNLVNRK